MRGKTPLQEMRGGAGEGVFIQLRKWKGRGHRRRKNRPVSIHRKPGFRWMVPNTPGRYYFPSAPVEGDLPRRSSQKRHGVSARESQGAQGGMKKWVRNGHLHSSFYIAREARNDIFHRGEESPAGVFPPTGEKRRLIGGGSRRR